MSQTTAIGAHGGLHDDELTRLGLRHEDVLDVSVNVNPYGASRVVLEAIRAASIERYPDPAATPARAALAGWLDVPRQSVVVGNGAVDLIWSLARCLVRPGDWALVLEPAFSELRSAATYAGAQVAEHRLRPEDDFALDPAALDAALRALRPRLVYLCTPGNPTGKTIPIDLLVRLADAHPHATFIVDLSFSSLSEGHRDEAVHASERIVWLRSLTKDLALAGLRVGFAVAPPSIVELIERSRPPWSVNALAQAAACAATTVEARAFVAESRARLLGDRVELELALQRLGLRTHTSRTLYTLLDLGPARRASDLREALLARHAVLVRDATSFGLPHHVRVCARPVEQLPRLLQALARELHR
ncbi:MAG TPA: histidinol-phosphate transaminase [Polyangiaceae bacterium]|nr:histidinol-phosphate transaminase [Polyangiaceae bacterium]